MVHIIFLLYTCIYENELTNFLVLNWNKIFTLLGKGFNQTNDKLRYPIHALEYKQVEDEDEPEAEGMQYLNSLNVGKAAQT